jgi:hypothetical protein
MEEQEDKHNSKHRRTSSGFSDSDLSAALCYFFFPLPCSSVCTKQKIVNALLYTTLWKLRDPCAQFRSTAPDITSTERHGLGDYMNA